MSSRQHPQSLSNTSLSNTKGRIELIEIEQQNISSLSLFDQLLYNNYLPSNHPSNFLVQHSVAIFSKSSVKIREKIQKIKLEDMYFEQPIKIQEENTDKMLEESISEDSRNNNSEFQCQSKLFPYYLSQSQFDFKFDCSTCQHKKTRKMKSFAMVPYWSIEDVL